MRGVQTVRGQVAAADLGITLPHEHVFANIMRERRGDGLMNDEDLMARELDVFVGQGGKTVVDLSSGELTLGSTVGSTAGRPTGSRDVDNVAALVRISERTGLNIVLGAGHYRDPYLDEDYFDSNSVDAIADSIVIDLTEGIPGTAVRAGVIGEIGSDKWYISAREERSFRAAARASNRTNAGVYTHAARWPVGLAQLELLQEESVPPDRIVVGHVDTVPDPGYALALAARGAFIGIDTMYQDTPRAIEVRVSLVIELVGAGFADRILLSQDVCVTSQLRSSGGPGFGHVLGAFRRAVLAAGIEEEVFDGMVVGNAARFLAG